MNIAESLMSYGSAQQEVEWREALALYFVDMSVSLQLSLVDVCDESM